MGTDEAQRNDEICNFRSELSRRLRASYAKKMIRTTRCRESAALDTSRNHDLVSGWTSRKQARTPTRRFSASRSSLMKPRITRHLLANGTVAFTRAGLAPTHTVHAFASHYTVGMQVTSWKFAVHPVSLGHCGPIHAVVMRVFWRNRGKLYEPLNDCC